ncbi:MAG: GNAT family N-acetyltransferase [Pseudomonadota bacterium]
MPITNPIIFDLPVPITTNRLLIRPPVPGDGPEFFRAVMESQSELKKWLSWASQPMTEEDAEINLRKAYASWILRESLRLSIFDKNSMRLLGSTGFHGIDWNVRKFEIGYWCRTPDLGKGYIGEAVTAITQFAFSELKARRIEIRTDAENFASIKIPLRLGFHKEAKIQSDRIQIHTGNLGDTLIFTRFQSQGLPNVDASWHGPKGSSNTPH